MEIKILFLKKILYVVLFVVILPLVMTLWAIKAEAMIPLPVLDDPILGIILTIGGLLLILFGVLGLYLYSNGLPMSPVPPTTYVRKGVYRFISHPIYTGAGMLAIGISILTKSASGLWLISPVLILSCVAFVLGFEKEYLRTQFPESHFKPLVAIPESSEDRTTVWNKISAYLIVLLPWLILYQMVLFLGMLKNPIITYLPFEHNIPVIEFSAVFYILIYPWVILAPLVVKTKKELKNFMVSGLMGTGIGIFILIIFPFATPLKNFTTQSVWGKLLHFSRFNESAMAAFPAFPVIWAFIATAIYINRFPSLKFLCKLIPVLITLSCITTGMYSIMDVFGGLCVFLFVKNRTPLWRMVQKFSEYIANSWKEWHVGRVRLINHGLYTGIGTLTGIFIVGTLIGKEQLSAIFIVALTSMICAALWAQLIEGSAKLLRPLGFYGGVLGIVIGGLLVQVLFGTDFFLILAAFSVAAPWIQGLGRLRCLVQGCCHGRVISPNIGIKYFHARSRVVRLANLKNAYLHPTQVYSILTNVVVAIVLAKLWFSNVPLPLLSGIYLILSGLGRFVEEAYRGEPQTPILRGLRLYQWLALIGIIAGAFFTVIPHPMNPSKIQFSMEVLFISLVLGLLALFLTGVDFPNSNRRFSRLV